MRCIAVHCSCSSLPSPHFLSGIIASGVPEQRDIDFGSVETTEPADSWADAVQCFDCDADSLFKQVSES